MAKRKLDKTIYVNMLMGRITLIKGFTELKAEKSTIDIEAIINSFAQNNSINHILFLARDCDIISKVYNKYYKFSEFEKTLFDSYLKHPYKFVKLGYRFYIQNKNIDELRLLNKLKKYCKYELNL